MTKGNVTQAARMAGRNRTEFYKLLSRHGLDAMISKRMIFVDNKIFLNLLSLDSKDSWK